MNYSKPKPYLIRAFYEWMNDNGLTPYLLINAETRGCALPTEHVKEGKIVLNIAPRAIKDLFLGNEYIEFHARFSGVSQRVYAPIRAISAIYAKENGEGMAFPDESDDLELGDKSSPTPPSKGKPDLKIVK